MVKSVACYDIEREIELDEIRRSLERYEPETEHRIKLGEWEFDISTQILDMGTARDQVFGTMEKVVTKEQTFRGHPYQVPVLHKGGFVFIGRSPVRLIVHAASKTADLLAPEFESLVFPNEREVIVRKRLNKEDIGGIYEEVGNGGEVKVSTFKDLTLPLLAKSSIYGPNVRPTKDYTRYNGNGRLSYMMFVARKYSNILLSINEVCQVTFYQNVDDKFIENFLEKEVFRY